MNQLVVISGCSGGGKSTLIAELVAHGYTTMPEVGREIIKEQLTSKKNMTPWDNPQGFCELLIERSIETYKKAKDIALAKDNIIFLDRSFLEGISYYNTIQIAQSNKYDSAIDEFRYYPVIFMTPPWEEIYTQDTERKHSFTEGVHEYTRLLSFYPKAGYQIIEIPRVTVIERFHFIIHEVLKKR